MTDEYLVEDNNSCATATTTTTTHTLATTTTTATTRKNNQNTFSWSSTSSSFSNSTLLTQDDAAALQDDEFSSLYLILLDEFFELPTNDKKEKKLSEILGRAASHGDIHTVRQIIMDERLRPYLNLDASDDEENDGSTPLIYASCFGKLDIVKYLLQVGAKVDVQDKSKLIGVLHEFPCTDILACNSWLDCSHVGHYQWTSSHCASLAGIQCFIRDQVCQRTNHIRSCGFREPRHD